MRQGLYVGGMYGENRVKKVCEADTLRFRDKSKECAVAIEAPRGSFFNDFDARLIIAVKKLVCELAFRVLIRELQRCRTVPLRADNGN